MKKGYQFIQYSCSNCTSIERVNNILKRKPKIIIFTNDLKKSENACFLNFKTSNDFSTFNKDGNEIEWNINWGPIPEFYERLEKKTKTVNKEYNTKLIETTKKIRKTYENTKFGKSIAKEFIKEQKNEKSEVTDPLQTSNIIPKKKKKKNRKSYENLLKIE